MWILREVLAQRKEANKPTYMTFIDVRKAYDRVWRAGLWKKLFDMGVRGKMLAVLQEMYRRVFRSVLINDANTEWVDVKAGVPQGAVLSPFLYSVYVNGLHQALRERGLGILVHGRLVPLLLYADDIVLLAESPAQMKKMHQVMEAYARKWRFTINNKKSSIVVVGSKTQVAEVRAMQWSLGGQTIKVVDEYKYLGGEMGKFGPGMWNTALKRFHTKASAAGNLITWVSRGKAGLRPGSALQLWFANGRPLLEYACEIWEGDISQEWSDKLEAVQTAFLRRSVGAGRSAPASALRRELGAQSLKIRREWLKIQYWLRIKHAKSDRLLSHLYRHRARAVDEGRGARSWCKGVERHGRPGNEDRDTM